MKNLFIVLAFALGAALSAKAQSSDLGGSTAASYASRQDLSANTGATVSATSYNWTVNINTASANPIIVVQGVDTMYIDWGDGTSRQAVALTSLNRTIAHIYATAGKYTVTFYNANNLTKFWAYGACSWSYNLSSVPAGLKYLAMTGANVSVTGNVSALPAGLDTLLLLGSNTVTGNYASLPRGLTMYVNSSLSNTVGGNIADLPRGLVYYLDYSSGTNPAPTGDIANLPPGLTYCDFESPTSTAYGNIGQIPRGLTYFNVQGHNTTSGNISGLPSGIRVFIDYGNNTITGNLSSIPRNDSLFFATGNNTLYGNLASVPASVSSFQVGGSNTVTGYTAPHTWNPNTYLFYLWTKTGGLTAAQVDSLFIDLDRCKWTGKTGDGIGQRLTVMGAAVAAPTSASAAARNDLTTNKHVTIKTNTSTSSSTSSTYTWSMSISSAGGNPSIVLQGAGTASINWGDGSAQQTVTLTSSDKTVTHTYKTAGKYTVTFYNANNLTKFSTSSDCNWSFGLSSIPRGMTYFFCSGSNTITGNLSSLPSGLTVFNCQGSNTVSGNLSSLPRGMNMFRCFGSNTITGNLSSLPSGMVNFYCAGSNTIAGNLSSLPAGINLFACGGSNTTTGNLSSLPGGVTFFLDVSANNTINAYTAGHAWSSNMQGIYLQTNSGGLTSAMVDNLFIDLDKTTWQKGGVISITGTGIGAPTSKSAAARNDLTTNKHVTIKTNTSTSSSTSSTYTWSVGISTTSANPIIVVEGVDTMYIDWGDGTSRQGVALTSSDKTVTHTYTTAGNYTVKFYDADNLTKFWAYGACSWSYNLSSVPSGLKYLAMTGANTVTGNVSALPTGLDTLMLADSNTVTGDYASLPRGLLVYSNSSPSDTVTGNLSDLPRGLTYYLDYSGANPGPTGDIADLPPTLTYCDLEAPHNTTYGDVGHLPSGLTYFNDQGNNATSGNISGLPSGIRVFIDYGNNTITGDLSSIPANDSLFFVTGKNTISGDLSSVPASVSSFQLQGDNTVTGYTAPHAWNPDTYLFLLTINSGGLTSAEVDSLFIDLDRCKWTGKTGDGIGEKLTVNGKAVSAPTSASAAARNDLITNKHVTIVLSGLETAITKANTPGSFDLFQNYPNPFNPTTVITYDIAKRSHVTLVLYDALGRKVATLVDAERSPGRYETTFNGASLPSGVYLYRLEAGTYTAVKKLMLVK